jgi:hypothetical protein
MADSDSTNKNYSDADNSLAIREDAQKFLPSTEVRELVPQLNDEIDLRDYLNTRRRKMDPFNHGGRSHWPPSIPFSTPVKAAGVLQPKLDGFKSSLDNAETSRVSADQINLLRATSWPTGS